MTGPIITIHACALRVGDAGLLIRGASGSGKSALTLALIAGAQAQGRSASLVADDRVALKLREGQLLASPHPLIAGQIEKRGTGILDMPHEPQVALTHVIDLVPEGEALPAAGGRTTLDGIALAHIGLPARASAEALAAGLLAKI
jgi:serine kinase of HPr protein (carbohydrate metabolism regulator)